MQERWVTLYFKVSIIQSNSSSLALNGGGRIFSPRPLPYFPCLLSRLVSSHLLRDSLCIALQTGKIMDLINWSLNAIDTIFSTRSLGSGEPDCPDGTFAAGYTMDAWERWRIVCLAALRPRPLLENQPWEEHCSETLLRSSPILQTPADYKLLHIHTYMHSPPHPRSLASVALNRQPDKRVCDQRREMAAGLDGCLPELDYFPCCKVVCLWCIMCFCCWGVFPVLTLYSQGA